MDSINSSNSDCAVLYIEKAMYLEMIHFIDLQKSGNPYRDSRTGRYEGMSGTQHISIEEAERKEKFYHITKQGTLHYLGKQPDATLREGDVIVAIKPDGKMRIANSKTKVKDHVILEQVRSKLTEHHVKV